MRKCDWCKKNSTCHGVSRSECIVREYRDFVIEDHNGQTSCCFCGKRLAKEMSIAEVRGGLRNKVLATLCEDCYRKYILLSKNTSILNWR